MKKHKKEVARMNAVLVKMQDQDRNDCSMKLYNQFYGELDQRHQIIVDKYLYDVRNPKWRPIYEDGELTNYEVSNTSEVRNATTHHVMKPFIDRKGYVLVSLHIHGGKSVSRRVHRLSSIAFIPNPQNKPQVNHINGIKDFNWIGNLEWNTAEENVRHAWLTGLQPYRYGEDSNASIYKNDEIHAVCKLLEQNMYTNVAISEITGVDEYTVSKVKCRGDWLKISSQYNIPDPVAHAQGEAAAASRYKEAQIRQVCEMLANTHISAREIENITGVGMAMIWRIKVGLNWSNISKDYNISANPVIPGINNRIYTEEEIHNACYRLQKGDRIIDISKDSGIKEETLSSLKNGRTWKVISQHYQFEKQAPGRTQSITNVTIHEICKLLTDGILTNKEIAEKVGVLPGFVSSIKQRTHYSDISSNYDFKTASRDDPRHSVLTESQVHTACSRMEKGDSAAVIARDMNVSQSCINALRKGRWHSITSQYNITVDHVNGAVNSRETAIKVCELLSQNKYKNTEIAKMLDVKASFVSDIKQRKQWKDVVANYTWILPSKPKRNNPI